MKDFTDTVARVRRIAIVGSRDYSVLTDVANIMRKIRDLNPNVTIITGGAKGVDSVAEKQASYFGMQVIIHEPDWDKHGRAAGPIRNQDIVDDCHMVIAFWDLYSKGTMSTVRLALKRNKPVFLFGKPGFSKKKSYRYKERENDENKREEATKEADKSRSSGAIQKGNDGSERSD